mmetsp:Transcript_72243/g.204767  ORF Transcript_72243/g.204767 Transcript_72243/m.204767 type:complete len:233 (-) Transcript_72243:958-1656(-)
MHLLERILSSTRQVGRPACFSPLRDKPAGRSCSRPRRPPAFRRGAPHRRPLLRLRPRPSSWRTQAGDGAIVIGPSCFALDALMPAKDSRNSTVAKDCLVCGSTSTLKQATSPKALPMLFMMTELSTFGGRFVRRTVRIRRSALSPPRAGTALLSCCFTGLVDVEACLAACTAFGKHFRNSCVSGPFAGTSKSCDVLLSRKNILSASTTRCPTGTSAVSAPPSGSSICCLACL